MLLAAGGGDQALDQDKPTDLDRNEQRNQEQAENDVDLCTPSLDIGQFYSSHEEAS